MKSVVIRVLVVTFLLLLVMKILSFGFLPEIFQSAAVLLPLLVFFLLASRNPDVDKTFILSSAEIKKALIYGGSASLLILPAFWLVQAGIWWGLGWAWDFDMRALIATFLSHFLIVALPEEAFFRGYVHTELVAAQNSSGFLLGGVHIGWGILVTTVIFAFSHSVLHFAFWHVLIVFPAFVFSWLREKTGSVWAPALFHALCNASAAAVRFEIFR